jgi:hypothetical protein
MGCGESKPKLGLDDFKLIPDGASKEEVDKIKATVDKTSIKAVWEKKYPMYELTTKDLDGLVPDNPITEENADETFPAFSDKFLKLADRKRRLDELAKDPKPFLEQFFKEASDYAGSCMDLTFGNILAIISHGDPNTYIQDQLEGWHRRKGKPLIAKSVDHHDINGDGVLDADESQLFFKHLMKCQVKFREFTSKLMVCKLIRLQIETQLSNIPTSDKEALQKKLEKDVMPQLQYQLQALDKAAEELFADEAKLKSGSKEAFALMDTNKDNTLSVEEVAAVLSPLSEKSTAFYKALGLDITEILKKAAEEFKEKEAKDKDEKKKAEGKEDKDPAAKN